MTDGINPKDRFGLQKLSISKVPSTALATCAGAMMLGAEKYGPYNWREKDVRATVYVDAALRHLYAWFEGEEVDPESGVSHLGHVMACAAILIDAQHMGRLADDRPEHVYLQVRELMQTLADDVLRKE